MNSNESATTLLANMQIGEPARPLPEQAMSQIPPYIPRPISFMSVIHQWQPMGIRVVVDLPFVSDDASTLFAIRNGPFIADWREETLASEWIRGSDLPPVASKKSIGVWGFAALNGVVQTTSGTDLTFPDKYGVHISYYDSPPLLSQISRCFRRWRGDMQYRIRVVAGFVTQGYLIIAPLKNSPKLVSSADPLSTFSYIGGTDTTSYRPLMQNSYIMSDTSMYRHIEITYPYEYPTPWYDQYQWIANRLAVDRGGEVTPAWGNNVFANAFSEPFSDNWLCVLLRGALEPTRDTAQITFELEYRAAEGFQFADPGLPPVNIHYISSYVADSWSCPYPVGKVLSIPSKTFESNGVNMIRKREATQKTSKIAEALSVPVVPKTMERVTPTRQRLRLSAPGRRNRDAESDGSNLGPRTVEDADINYEDLDPALVDAVNAGLEEREKRSLRRRDLEFSY